MAEFMVRGGANVGWGWQGWPFAKLIVSETSLRLWVFMSPGFTFTPYEVVSLNRYLLGGIQIIRNRPDYPPDVVFYYPENVVELLARIRVAGFSGKAPSASAMPANELQPLKMALGFIVGLIFAVIIFALYSWSRSLR